MELDGHGDTIAALSSGRPPAAIAVIRMSGPACFAIAASIAGPLPAPRHAALRNLRDSNGEILDSGLVLAFPAPASSTGEDIVEFHCHGGRAVVEAVMRALVASGARLAEAGEFTRRALANGRLDLTEAEGLADLLSAETERQRRAALARASGAVRRRVEAWRDQLLDLSAAVEHAIDYSEEDETVSVAGFAQTAQSLAVAIEQWLSEPRLEPLRDGVRVVLVGPPNCGKSSLLNCLCEDARAIVTPVAGTTRDSIEVPLAIDGVPLVLIDTAGLRDSQDEVETLGIARTRAEIERADLILWLDPAAPPGEDDRVLAVHAKADLRAGPADRLPVSSITGEGVVDLRQAIVDRAVIRLPAAGQDSLTAREANWLVIALHALRATNASRDLAIVAELLRQARDALDRLVGRAGIENVLDALFSRFCVGK